MPVLAVQYLALSRGALWGTGVNRAYHVAIMGCVPATLQKLQTRHTYTSIIIELLTIAILCDCIAQSLQPIAYKCAQLTTSKTSDT